MIMDGPSSILPMSDRGVGDLLPSGDGDMLDAISDAWKLP
jgi:hypothetical protein